METVVALQGELIKALDLTEELAGHGRMPLGSVQDQDELRRLRTMIERPDQLLSELI